MIRVQLRVLAPDPEQEGAWQWLSNAPGISGSRAAWDAPAADAVDVAWLHSGLRFDPLLVADSPRSHPPGAGWLLTGTAAALAAPLGLGPAPDVCAGAWLDRGETPSPADGGPAAAPLRGHAGFRNHPLFEQLHNGACTWRPRADEAYALATLGWAQVSDAVRVLATERADLRLNAERITAWECSGEAGFAVCIGAWLPFAAHDPHFQAQVERLARNALQHVARGAAAAAAAHGACWPTPGRACHRDPALPLPHGGVDRPGRVSFAATPLRMSGGEPSDPFTLAGRRALVAGREGRGVEELWVHPLRALSDLQLVGAELVAAEITALGIERTLRVGEAVLDERVLVPHELGALVVEWETSTDVTVTVAWRTDLRLAGPYPPGTLGDIRWRTAEHAFVARAGGAPDLVCCRFSRAPRRWEVTDVSGDAPALQVRAVLELRAGESLRLLVAASSSGDDDVHATLAALRDPLSLGRARTAALRRLLTDSFSIASPEPRLDEAVAWAKYRLDSYLVATPGVGRSQVAGYWRSRPGEDDGRPGHAWYFGPAAVWTAIASLGCGDFDAAADVIRFLGEWQDLSGSVLQECTTSGLAHYDAADASPLYLLLVARYYAWTGEIGFINSEWERVERALRFCLSTDTDGDELIESPVARHVTYHDASIWAAALRELAIVAQDIGARSLATELHTRAQRARLALEERFFDPARRRYALRAWQGDGEWRTDFSPAATHAVPLLLGVADPDRAGRWLDDVASDAFSTDWGVRSIPTTHPAFDPQSYDGGAVRPLYTGWAAWAEYAAGRSQAASRHLLANAGLVYERAKGAWDEVLHGTRLTDVEGCPDHAGSAALTVAPLVYGLFGAEPDAARNRLRLRPQFPDSWDHFEARLVRLGDCAVTLRYERHARHHVFRLEQERGAAPVRVILEAVLAGRGLRHALVDGTPARLAPQPFAGRMLVPVQVVLDAERVIEIYPE